MSDWTVHLEFEEGTSSKFWRARVDDKTLYVNYGKIGSAGQTQVKDFGNAALAQSEYDKLVREKRKKGYVDAGSGGGGGGADDDEDDDTGDDDDDAPALTAALKASAKAAAPPASGRPASAQRMVLEAGSRKVETWVWVDDKAVHMESIESYAGGDAAKKAYERLKKALAGEGYKDG
ncbi:MAG TPA: WGR domain-containing protein [Kofleriaceae bacterium]|nr:WGR domain-containing protein [Kofleriaceae bacterium]